MQKVFGTACVVFVVGCATILGVACGNDFDESNFVDPNGTDGGDNGFGDGSAGEGGGGDANTPSPNDSCNGSLCANYTGPKDFVEPGAPPNAGAIFGGANASPNGTDPAKEPRIIYPSHETMFPINVSHIRHDWSAGASTNNLFRLVFEGPKTTVTVYTVNKDWQPTDEQWDWIAESNRGGSVKLTVTALDTASPGTAYTSQSITELFSIAEVPGAIYYWSTGSAGVMRGLISESVPQKFYTDPNAADKGTCVACHTVSRDGKRLAVGYGGEKLKEVGIPDRNAIVPATGNPDRAVGWTTFSPDSKLLLVASAGVLTLIDADTGAPVGPNNGLVPLGGQKATHPDWSGLGDQVVVSIAPTIGNKDIKTGSIALIPYNNGAWGAPNVIVPSANANDNNFFPAFSPDNKWIVYVNATGNSKDQVTSHLRIVPVTGGTPKDLVRLNQRVNNADAVTGIGNSMPRWAPSTKPGVFWLAFSSVRAYSILRPQDDKSDQIWIGAVDTTAADPSYSAFWAPFQAMPEGNHRPFWAVVAGDKNCGCVDICGDGIDNDCNGVADGPGCVTCAATEIPNNGIDDNCDCVIDNVVACDPDDPACTVK
jgi:hypothetical protein